MDVLSEKKATLCGICHKADSCYTCPRCNVPYCSVKCYQEQEHAECSEEFYRDSVMAQLQAQRAEQGQGGDAMLVDLLKAELAKRNEDASLLDQDDGGDFDGGIEGEDEEEEDDEDGPSLEGRLAGIDLDSADPETVLQLLTGEERREFESLLDNPSEQADLVQLWRPWWEDRKPLLLPVDPASSFTMDKFGALPHFTQLTKVRPSDDLPCNLVNILYAYCSSMRLYNGELNVEFVLEVCSVLADNVSYHTVDDSVQSAVALCTQSSAALSLDFCSVLARDMCQIVSNAASPVMDASSISAPLYALVHLYDQLQAERSRAETAYKHCPKEDCQRAAVKARYSRLKRLPEKLHFFLVWAKSAYTEWKLLTESLQVQADLLARRVADTNSQLKTASDARSMSMQVNTASGTTKKNVMIEVVK